MADENAPPEILGPFQFTVLVLSCVVLVTLVIDTTVDLPAEVSTLLQRIDNTVCIVLLFDVLIRFRHAQSKADFMRWGWIDVIASIPTLEIFRLGRLVRIFRVLRMLRGVRLVHRIVSTVFRNRLRGGVATGFLTVFLLLCFSSISILICEQHPESNIRTADDAIWWSFETLTTVGYGDRYPVTAEGRIVAIVLMLSGLGLFGTISGLTAAMFAGMPGETDSTEQLAREVSQLRAEITALRGRAVKIQEILIETPFPVQPRE